jgi:hypothetical protein
MKGVFVMNAQEMQKQIQKHSFIENNGKILRLIHMMDSKEHKIGSIRYILHDVPLEELRNSFHYLHDSGYVRIDHPEGAACIGEDKDNYSRVKVEITSSGMEILMGVKSNPAVEM